MMHPRIPFIISGAVVFSDVDCRCNVKSIYRDKKSHLQAGSNFDFEHTQVGESESTMPVVS